MKDSLCIFAATDFSPLGNRAVTVAAEWASRTGASVVVAHVFEQLAFDPKTQRADDMPLYAEAKRRLEGLASAVPLPVDRVRTVMPEASLQGGAPWDRILGAAKACDADVVVVGTHGRKGLARFVLGSVAENVVRNATVPVMVVPPGEEGG